MKPACWEACFLYPCPTVEHSNNCLLLLCVLFLKPSGHYTKIDKKATIFREQTDMGGKYDSNTVSVKWGTDSYGNYYIYILVDGTAVCALPGWTRLD